MIVPFQDKEDQAAAGTKQLRQLSPFKEENVWGTLKPSDDYSLEFQEAFEVYLVPDDETTTHLMRFEYELSHFKARELAVQLDFENPTYVSQSSQPDKIVVRFKDSKHFVSSKG